MPDYFPKKVAAICVPTSGVRGCLFLTSSSPWWGVIGEPSPHRCLQVQPREKCRAQRSGSCSHRPEFLCLGSTFESPGEILKSRCRGPIHREPLSIGQGGTGSGVCQSCPGDSNGPPGWRAFESDPADTRVLPHFPFSFPHSLTTHP